jgi:hypothetical protein
MIEFSEQELNALPVPEYSFACVLACMAGKMIQNRRTLTEVLSQAREENESTLFV